MRLLVFCGTRAALNWYAEQLGWIAADNSWTIEQRANAVEWFRRNESANLAVSTAFLHGWRAPADTQVLFDPSWRWGPDSPEWKQAAARRDLRLDLQDVLQH